MEISRDTATLPDAFRLDLEQRLTDHAGTTARVYDRSMVHRDGVTYLLVRHDGEKKLAVMTDAAEVPFAVEAELAHPAGRLWLCPCTAENAAALRATFPWTAPRPLGTETALGCGDRLGLATPGHIRACRAAGVRPVLAQQSIREMERTGRSPQEVLDDVTWAVFQEGYTGGFGADADHLKTRGDVDRCFAAGYTMYTVDPSDYVDDAADRLGEEALEARFERLPWEALGTTPAGCLERYAGQTATLKAPLNAPPEEGGEEGEAAEGEALRIDFDAEALKRAAVKYGAAIAHTKELAEHLAARYAEARPGGEAGPPGEERPGGEAGPGEVRPGGEAYDLEMSVDETAHPTRPREHYFVAAELQRLGVEVTSLAPRFVGAFQKGIDFIGAVDAFEQSFRQHAAIARSCGGYKLSIHSGSDKFSVYPVMGRYAGDRLHLKTAGTSYLEALRVVARRAPALFREIVGVAFARFEADRKTYHVTTDLAAIPDPEEVSEEALEAAYLDAEDGRQLLHLTYGSVLTARRDDGAFRFKDRIFAVLDEHEEEHYETLQAHFDRHLRGVRDA